MYELVDFVTKERVYPKNFVFTGEQSPWEVNMNLEGIRSKLNLHYFKSVAPSFLKYLPFLPIKRISECVSLQETATPLVKSRALGERLKINLYFKLEGKNPTGSFKDRGSSVEISIAKEMGAKAVILASTGNMAASCACYAAAAKMPCYVLVPEGVSLSKLAQVMAYGGRITQVKGTYNDAAQSAKETAEKKGFYLAGDYAFRVEGQKTAAFELMDQLLFNVPDAVILPIGCGTNMAAYAKGFSEYRALALIHRVPKLVGVQSELASSVVNSFQKKSRSIEGLPNAHTLASAIAVPNPIDGVKALDAIYKTNGSAYSVSDQEILEAHYLLSTEEGLFVETASAATVAALMKMVLLDPDQYRNQTIVCVLTGDGLKDSHVVLDRMKKA